MSPDELLRLLNDQQIEVWAEAENLRYKAPKGALTESLAALLRANKPALLERLRQPQRAVTSFTQANIWMRDQIQPQSRLFNVPEGLHLRGPLNLEALETSLNEIVRRHAALRTTFAYQDGDVLQLIQPYSPARLPLLDLSGLPADRRAEAARQAAYQQGWEQYDLAARPGFRPGLLRLAGDEHLLLLNFHLILIDGWSFGLLLQELTRFYRLHTSGEGQRPAPLRAQFADFAAWQRAALPGLLAEHLPFWQARQQETAASLPLPYDRPRPAHPSGRAQAVHLTLPHEEQRALNEYARRQGASLYALLLAGLAVLMTQLSAGASAPERFWLGSPTSYRTRTEFEPLIGRMVNTLLIQADLSGRPTWAELIRRMQRSALESFEHQDLPFEELLPALKFKRGPQGAPLPQVTLNLHNYPLSDELALPGIQAELFDIPIYPAHADLQFHVRPRQEGLHIKLLYDQDLFQAASAAGILQSLQKLLQACLDGAALPAAPAGGAGQPQPAGVRPGLAGQEPARPLSPLEARLCELAAESLGLDEAHLDDSFFALGGNSLRAARFLSLLHARLGAALPLTALYEYTNLGEIAAYLRSAYPELDRRSPDGQTSEQTEIIL
jgi:acyl carrier protein